MLPTTPDIVFDPFERRAPKFWKKGGLEILQRSDAPDGNPPMIFKFGQRRASPKIRLSPYRFFENHIDFKPHNYLLDFSEHVHWLDANKLRGWEAHPIKGLHDNMVMRFSFDDVVEATLFRLAFA